MTNKKYIKRNTSEKKSIKRGVMHYVFFFSLMVLENKREKDMTNNETKAENKSVEKVDSIKQKKYIEGLSEQEWENKR